MFTNELIKCTKELDEAIKSFKDVEATHKAHKDAAAGFHAAAKDASRKDAADNFKDSIGKAFKDLTDAIKAHKDACDVHKDACTKLHKAILGPRDKMDIGDLRKSDTADLRERLAKQDRILGFVPTAGVDALLERREEGNRLPSMLGALSELDPSDPLYELKKAARNSISL